MNKLIIASVALILLTTSYTGHSQTEASPVETPKSLESEYQKELDRWMLQAYEGDRDAQFKVGVLFTNDQFESADFEQSAYWYKQAARQGHALAQYNLGHLYLTGNGTKRSETEAMKWWLKAAEQDHPLAQFNVGRAYYLGIGLDEDHSQSRYWFKRAAKNNEPKSIDILEQLGWSKKGEHKNVTERNDSNTQVATETQKENTLDPKTTKVNSEANSTAASTIIEQDVATEVASIEPPVTIEESDTPLAASSANNDETSNAETPQPIAVYTNPAKRSVLIAIIDIRKQLSVTNAGEEWTEVTNENGFPVWVHQDYIIVSDDIGSIQGDAVNARSVPLITNGTVVGQLNNNETLVVIDKKEEWYRVISPNRFKAWVKTEEFNRKESQTNNNQVAQDEVKPVTPSRVLDNDNDNDWLFSQAADSYTLQLASFDDQSKISEFASRKKFLNNPNLYSFTSTSQDIEWTYFLYGAYSSSESAKQARSEIKQKLAWVRSFGKLQQNRCVSWKKQIPTPKELNKYCS